MTLCLGRGVQAADGGLLVRHDWLRRGISPKLQTLSQLQQEDHGLQRER